MPQILVDERSSLNHQIVFGTLAPAAAPAASGRGYQVEIAFALCPTCSWWPSPLCFARWSHRHSFRFLMGLSRREASCFTRLTVTLLYGNTDPTAPGSFTADVAVTGRSSGAIRCPVVFGYTRFMGALHHCVTLAWRENAMHLGNTSARPVSRNR